MLAFAPRLHGPLALMVPGGCAFWFAVAVLGFFTANENHIHVGIEKVVHHRGTEDTEERGNACGYALLVHQTR